jgi:hypothetical protein
MVRKISLLIFVLSICSFFGNAQKYGVGGSFDILNPVGKKKFLPGVTVFFDVPKTDNIAFYGKLGYYFPTSIVDTNAYAIAIDPMTNPYQVSAENKTVINIISLQGGTKYFVGNAYNVGFAGMFDTHFRLLVSPVKSSVTGYDAKIYQQDPNVPTTAGKYVSMNLFAGVGAGVKYSQPWGTLFASANIDLILFYLRPTALTSSFMLSVEVGYRRDIY